MEGYRLNPDESHVKMIMEGLIKKNGHCPCQIKEDESTLCPCDKFLVDRNCCCKLYVEKE